MTIKIRNNCYFAVFKQDKKWIHYGYSIMRYGEEHAKILAELSLANKKKYQNYIVEENDYAILKLHSSTFGYYDFLIDKEDIEKIQKCRWCIESDNRVNRNRVVARNYTYGLLHRYILNLKNPDIIVDHISRNTLDNRKSNLRIANNSINQRNKNLQSNNTSGFKGVRFNDKLQIWTAKITDLNHNSIAKSFSINKYGFEEAKTMALNWRLKQEQLNGYL